MGGIRMVGKARWVNELSQREERARSFVEDFLELFSNSEKVEHGPIR